MNTLADPSTCGRPPRWPAHLHVASLFVALVVITVLGRHGWFRGDEWHFFTGYDLRTNPLEVFRPHNEHLVALPLLIYKSLYRLVGLTTYRPYLAVLTFAHLALAHVVWRLALRARVDARIASGLVAILLFFGPGAFNILYAFQISFVASTAFGIVGLFLAETEQLSRRRVMLVGSAALLSILSSGIGPVLALMIVLHVALRHGVRRAAGVSPPLFLYGLWFLVVGRHHLAAAQGREAVEFLQLPDFVWLGVSGTLDATLGVPAVGGAVSIALLGYFTIRGKWRGRDALVTTLLAGTALFFITTGSGRLLFGPEYSQQPRYLYVALALLIIPLGVALTEVSAGRPAARPIICAFLLIAASRSAYLLRFDASVNGREQRAERQRILAAAKLVAGGEAVVSDQTIVQAQNLDLGGLRRLVRWGAFDDLLPDEGNDLAELAARASLQIEVRLLDRPPTEAPLQGARVRTAVGVDVEEGMSSCAPYESVEGGTLVVDPSSAVRLTISPTHGGVLSLALRSHPDDELQTEPVAYTIGPGGTAAVQAHVPDATLVLVLPAGPGTICGLGS